MKKILLLLQLWLSAGSVYILAGQADVAFKGGGAGIHEARFLVSDYNTKKPISRATVYDATDNQVGQTDDKGVLVVDLPASSADAYLVTSTGFNPLHVRLTHADRKAADYEIFLRPETTKADKPAPVMESANSNQDKVKVYVKQDPSAYQKSKETQNANVQFAVQLSASTKPASKATLKSWEDIGPVYVHSENGLYKVRIGPYNTQEGAKAVLLQAKARGTKDAFIVVQQGIENHKPYEFPEHPVTDQQPTTQDEPVVVNADDSEIGMPQGEYKVRLASYLHPGAFKTSEVEKYGPLESYRQGEWTIMLIGGIKSEAEARRIKDEVVAKGFKDAAVVIDQDGILVETH